jgi:hypothetical protein
MRSVLDRCGQFLSASDQFRSFVVGQGGVNFNLALGSREFATLRSAALMWDCPLRADDLTQDYWRDPIRRRSGAEPP